ncbi:MAG: LOG family protein [Candidatus Odinarchaeota archaeon]
MTAMINNYSVEAVREAYKPIVTVFGSSSCGPETRLYRLSEEIGSLLARYGFTSATGGYTGTMDAVAKGAKKEQGKSIGITTKEVSKINPNVSAYLTEEFCEETLMSRLDLLINIGDIFLFLPGSTGTLTELSLVWDKQKLGITPIKPCILFSDTWRKIFRIMFVDGDPLVPTSTFKKEKAVQESTYLVNSIKELDDLLHNGIGQ